MDLLPAESKEAGDELSINTEYARRFQHNKQRAEQHRLEEKVGKGRRGGSEAPSDTSGSESSSEEETEDSEGEQVTADVDAAILRTIAKIRGKDESIYDATRRVFEDERSRASASHTAPPRSSHSASSSKKITLADYQRSRVNELIKKHEDPAAALAEATTAVSRGFSEDDRRDDQLAPAEEEKLLQQEVTRAFHDDLEEGDDDVQQDFFTRSDAPHSAEGDSEAYRAYLLSALGADKQEKVRELLEGYGQDAPALDGQEDQRESSGHVSIKKRSKGATAKRVDERENEDFLTSYILNRGWIDRPDAAPRPRVASSSKVLTEESGSESEAGSRAPGRNWEAEAAALASEEEFDDRAEAYETAYNFRFEALQAGKASEQVQSYARNPQGSARRQDTKRKDQRAEREARKQEEKRQKMSDLKRLAELKQRNVIERLRRLREVTGSSSECCLEARLRAGTDSSRAATDIKLEDLDLDGDFDPAAHDRAMQMAFDEDYYNEQDAEFGGGAPQKPTWGEEEEEQEDMHLPNGSAAMEDEEIEMDADFMPGNEELGNASQVTPGMEKLSKKERKKLKKKLKAAEKKVKRVGEEGEAEEVEVGEEEMDADRIGPREVQNEKLDEAGQKRELDSAVDAYYNANYEDVIGDQPTRFKYEPTAKTDYGLSAVEILLADDEELNAIVGLKQLQPYRRGRAKPHDLKRRLKEFRSGLQARYGGDYAQKGLQALDGSASASTGAEVGQKPRKRIGKKERNKRKAATEDEQGRAIGDPADDESHKRAKNDQGATQA